MSVKTLLFCAFCLLGMASAGVFGQANTSLSNLANPTSINRSLVPSNNTHSLGTGFKAWKTIYLNGELYLGNTRTISGDLPDQNFYLGPNAGNLAATGTRNMPIGISSLRYNTTGYGNVAGGYYTLNSNSTGYENTAFGSESGRYNSSGRQNTFIGFKSGYHSGTEIGNTFVGYNAGYNGSGHYSSAFGFQALYSCANISYNSAFGAYAAFSTTGGGYNAAFGYQAMKANTSGNYNSVFGSNAMFSSTSGSMNAYFGASAGLTTKGSYNAYFGAYAGSTVKGSNNTFIGYHTAGFVDSVKNSTALGHYTIISASNQVRVGDLNVTSIGGFQPWSNLSDGRFKKDVQENVPGLAFINKLRPVTYSVKMKELDNYMHRLAKQEDDLEARTPVEDNNRIMTGFVAQEVEAAAKELDFTFDGVDAPKNEHDLYALRYAEFVVPLVKAVQELSRLNSEKDSIIAEFKEAFNEIARKDGRPLPYDGKISLSQNFPNPVGQSTVIQYALPDQFRSAEIALTDAAGKMIKRISLGRSSRGNISLNTATLASGVYHYSLIVDGKVASTRKLMVAR